MQIRASGIAVLITCVCTHVFWNCWASEFSDESDRRLSPSILSSALPRMPVPSRGQLSHDLGGLKDIYHLDAVIVEARSIIHFISGYKPQPKPQIPWTRIKIVEVKNEVTAPIVSMPQADIPVAPVLSQPQPSVRYNMPPIPSSALPILNRSIQIKQDRDVVAPLITADLSAAPLNTQKEPDRAVGVDVTVPIINVPQVASQDTPILPRSPELPVLYSYMLPRLNNGIQTPEPVIATPVIEQGSSAPQDNTETGVADVGVVDVTVPIMQTAPQESQSHAERLFASEQVLNQPRNVELAIGVDVTASIEQPAIEAMQIQTERSEPGVGSELTVPIDLPFHAVAASASETPLPGTRNASTSTSEQLEQESIYFLMSFYTQTMNGNSAIATSYSPINTTGPSFASSAPVAISPIVLNSSPFQAPALPYIRLTSLQSLDMVQQSGGIPTLSAGKRADITYSPTVQQMSLATYQAQQPIYSGAKSVFLNNSKHSELTPGNVMFVRNLIIKDTVQKPTEEVVNNFMNNLIRFLFLLVAL